MAASPSWGRLSHSLDREPLPQSDAHRYHHLAAGTRQDSDQSRIHRRRPSPSHLETMGYPCGPGARPDHRSHAEDHFAMREMAQHERANGGREARHRRSASYGNNACDGEMGIRANSMRVLALRRIWRCLPLRHARRPTAWHVGELFLNADPFARSTSRRTAYEVSFSPMMPERMRPIQVSRSNVAGSLKRYIPSAVAPMVPMPVHIV